MPSINGRTFTEQIRDVIYVFWDNENKQLREQPIMTFIPRKISDDRKALLRLFTKLLVDTDFINDLGAREYLASKGETYKDVANRLNLNADTVRKRVFYYCSVSNLKGKIVEKFGDTFLTEIIQYPNHDITSIEQAIECDNSQPKQGQPLMTTRYCLRRELGACLKEESSKLPTPLFLRNGKTLLRVNCDCSRCEMTITLVEK